MNCISCGKEIMPEEFQCQACTLSHYEQNTSGASGQNTSAASTPPPPQITASDLLAYKNTMPMTIGQFISMFVILLIPVINIILLLVWSFSRNTNINQKNAARAILILLIIIIIGWFAVSYLFSFILIKLIENI